MAGSVLRTPISAKYCWFGWWLGAWSTSSHHPTQLCDIYISGYKYTLISEWTRLFGLLRILDNLIAGAVCYFCTAISVFCEIYTLRMRVVAHAAIVWVGWFLCRRLELGLSICPHHMWYHIPVLNINCQHICSDMLVFFSPEGIWSASVLPYLTLNQHNSTILSDEQLRISTEYQLSISWRLVPVKSVMV